MSFFKQIANFGSLLRQAKDIAERMQELHDDLRKQRVVGSAGGGMVEIEANGLSEIITCRIDPQLFEQNDREMVEELVVAATNQAIAKAKQLHIESLRSLTGGIDLPGLDALVGDFVGANNHQDTNSDDGESSVPSKQ